MLFTAQHHSADRSFELVRRSLLQDQDLPFADALTTSQIEQAFEAEGILFGVTPQNPDRGPWGHCAVLKLRCHFAQILRVIGFDLF